LFRAAKKSISNILQIFRFCQSRRQFIVHDEALCFKITCYENGFSATILIMKGGKAFFLYKQNIPRHITIFLFSTLLLSLFFWSDNLEAGEFFNIEAQRWTEAEKIFHSDPHWLGGDGAASIDLGNGRVLWLFGDSFIDLAGTGSRRSSDLVRNSLAIQRGYDPSMAKMKFYWKIKEGKPKAFFGHNGNKWFWPASGIMLGKHLIIFLMEIKEAGNELGFEACGWKAVWIDNPQEEPNRWKLTWLISPQMKGLVVGSGNPLLEKGFLTVCAADSRDRAVYLVRWPESSAATGTLVNLQYWSGDRAGWVQGEKHKPVCIITDGQMEFSVQYQPKLNRYLQVQTLSVMNPCLALSSAASMTGPWSLHTCFFTPGEQGSPELLIYAGKSHPELKGADMVFTYVVNTTREDILLDDMSIYFPVMLKGRIIASQAVP